MNYTQNQKIEQVTETTLVVGVDIGSTKQYARAFDWRGREVSRVFTFMDCRDGYELFLKWMQELQSERGKDKIMVGCEPTGITGLACGISWTQRIFRSSWLTLFM